MSNRSDLNINEALIGSPDPESALTTNPPERSVKKYLFKKPWVIYSPADGIAVTTIRDAVITIVDREVPGVGVSTSALWYFEQQNHYFQYSDVRLDFEILDSGGRIIDIAGRDAFQLCTNWGNKSGEKAIKPEYFEIIASACLRFVGYGRRC